MLTRNRIPLLLACIFILEAIIYLWAWLTTEPEFVFDKCARNSGRASSLINLAILLMIGYYGFKAIYRDKVKFDMFRILMTLFTVNHACHFFYVYRNFQHHAWNLSIVENLHGFITAFMVVLAPIFIWGIRRGNMVVYILLTLHLFNVSYFIMETFSSKVKPDKPAYHNQLGILVTSLAMVYVLYRFYHDYKKNGLESSSISGKAG